MAEIHRNIPRSPLEIYHNIYTPAMVGEWVPLMLAQALQTYVGLAGLVYPIEVVQGKARKS